MARYLITGGCGFIGGHLARALVQAGNRVTVLDDLSSGREGNLPPEADLERGCVTDGARLAAIAGQCDGIVHLAAIASVEAAAADPRRAEAVNLGGARNAVEAARTEKLPLVYASSAAVYGDAGPRPIAETHICAPLSAYGRHKLESESAVLTLGPRATIIRPFNVYGPRQHPASPYSGVIARFISACLAGETITVNGEGLQSRDFIYVGDIVRLFLAAMSRAPEAPLTVNGCTGQAISILKLTRAIGEACGTDLKLRHGPARPGDILHSRGNPRHAHETLGFQAEVRLGDGLADTIAWLREEDQ
ncbi:MAG: NAD-dependent epimerase/dehydratase family protein [Nisaea sp.]|uniref:NAD-dependent epimerase/dehydratase family protein n=1 Tax=Nisaea sp. TaxID=2024842 RepID=UPI001B19565C|nr:NAD-dependent epimerase/dehydratase family protein [Nisaea sp.]MBO6560590.1 NAD-dependent epimerase/dehydratase family protein [Nisaea sp.]